MSEVKRKGRPPREVSGREVADVLEVSDRTLRRLKDRADFPAVYRTGAKNASVYRLTDVLNFKKQLQKEQKVTAEGGA